MKAKCLLLIIVLTAALQAPIHTLYAQPNIITLTPIHPPIQVPPQGGTFSFNATIFNPGPGQGVFIWARLKNPNGTYTGPIYSGTVYVPPGMTITRTQTVLGSWPPGQYWYIAYAGDDSSWFIFTKLADGASPQSWEASCSSKPFSGEALRGQPSAFSMVTVTPDPFNPTTAISYQLSANSHVSLQVYDTAGRLVTTLVDGWREAGTHEVTFDGSRLPSGVYLYTLSAGGQSSSGKMVLLK